MSIENNILVKLNEVGIKQNDKWLVRGVSLEVKNNDFITIVGPNGAGKSVLLECLMGTFIPNSGSIKRKKNISMGYIPQNFNLEKSMPISVKRFLNLNKKFLQVNLDRAIEETGILSILNSNLATLSGGELQKVLLARSLLSNPELLILDEPAQNLDIKSQLNFYNLLNEIFENRNLSILMVSHDLHMVMASTRKVICLFNHICCSGEPQKVAKDPEFINLFGNDMAKMMSVYQHTHDHTHNEKANA